MIPIYAAILMLVASSTLAQTSNDELMAQMDELSAILNSRRAEVLALRAELKSRDQWWKACVSNPQCVEWLAPKDK